MRDPAWRRALDARRGAPGPAHPIILAVVQWLIVALNPWPIRRRLHRIQAWALLNHYQHECRRQTVNVRPASEYRALMEANAELRRERDHAREEWHRQNERADDYRRQLLDETYRPEGGEIVLRELRRTQRERDDARAKIAAIEPFLRDEAANDSPEAQRLLLMLAAVPETTGEQP